MADNVTANPGAGGALFATDEIGGVHYPITKVYWGPLDTANPVALCSGLPVQQDGSWTVSISGSVAVTGPLTDAQLRATPVPVSGPLTDAQLRASPVPVSAVTDLTPSNSTNATVGVASAEAVAAAATRKGLHLRNTSTSGQRISLAFDGESATLDDGVTMYPQDVYEMDAWDFTTGAVAAIASAAGGRLSIQEWTT